MKKPSLKFINILIIIVLFVGGAQKAFAQYSDDMAGGDEQPSYQTFYDDLSPYGQWVQDNQYGDVWVPNAEAGFRPYYSGGHWVVTEYGNTWVSNYPWGWATFHYGRWTYNPYYGWVWIPGDVWGPAWVGWRSGNGYYGWAPLGPGFEFGSEFGDYACPDDWWIFIPPAYLYNPHYYRYWSGPSDNPVIIGNTGIVRNTYVNNHVTYVTGPRPREVQQITGQTVPVYHLVNSPSRTGSSIHGTNLRLYHPLLVRQTNPDGVRPVPANVLTAPQNIGRPQATGVREETPVFRSAVSSGSVTPVPVMVDNVQGTPLPAAPQRRVVTPRHQIQADDHGPTVQPAPRSQTQNIWPQQPPRQASPPVQSPHSQPVVQPQRNPSPFRQPLGAQPVAPVPRPTAPAPRPTAPAPSKDPFRR